MAGNEFIASVALALALGEYCELNVHNNAQIAQFYLPLPLCFVDSGQFDRHSAQPVWRQGPG